jgi:hypothetical protein
MTARSDRPGRRGANRTVLLVLLAAFPFTTFIAWLVYRGSPLALPLVVVAFVVSSPMGASMAARKGRTTPQEAYERMVRRSRTIRQTQWRKGGQARAAIAIQTPMLILGVAWFGLGAAVLSRWGRRSGQG